MKTFKKCLILFSAVIFIYMDLSASKVAIFYDGQKDKSEAFISASFTAILLHHFKIEELTISHIDNWEIHLNDNLDCVFMILEEGYTRLPSSLLKVLVASKITIVWLNKHINQLIDSCPERFAFNISKELRDEECQITYLGEYYPKEDKNFFEIKIANLQKTLPLAKIVNKEGNSFPYIIRQNNLWYIADSPYSYANEGGRFLVLADLLHEILNEDHFNDHKALVRIEDVNPQSDPKSLVEISDYLSKEKTPFQISLTPIYRGPDTLKDIYLSDTPELVKALKYASNHGATFVMHGITHQYSGTSTDDYEFWDPITQKPISEISREWIEHRLKLGISECSKNGIYPLAWETPHYSSSQQVYEFIASYFDTFYERMMVADIPGSQQILPYLVYLKKPKIQIIPENLGYIPYEKPEADIILNHARKLYKVRDSLASFYFHPFVDIVHLQRIISGMKKMGWKFISLKDFAMNIRTPSQWITSQGGLGTITLANQYFHEAYIDPQGNLKNEQYSPKRISTLLTKRIELSPGYLYFVEAIDISSQKKKTLPEVKKPIQLKKYLIINQSQPNQTNSNNQNSFISAMTIFGFNPTIKTLGVEKKIFIEGYDVIIIPNGTAQELKEIEINTIMEFIETGGILITDGSSPLAEKLNLRFGGKSVLVEQIEELTIPTGEIKWNPPISLPALQSNDLTVLAKESKTEIPLAVIKNIGLGKVLFLATLFDPFTPYGVSRFPYFPYYLKNELGLGFNIRRNTLEFYFDPGLRQNSSWETLVKSWSQNGVKIIYLAAWHFYQNYQFDYGYFINLCHDFGIAVYAWFEFPQVSPKFWNNFPQWREKTVSGKDAENGWRLQMNLFNPQAREAAGALFKRILNQYDWDGINLAEICYDTNKGLQNSGQFTPMNEDVRKAFKQKEGIDPIDLFNSGSPLYWKINKRALKKFIDFRSTINKDLHVYFLRLAGETSKSKQKEMEIIVTVLDSLNHPEIIEECGIDILQIIDLMNIYPFTLQIEDPSHSWSGSPIRYHEFFKEFKNHIKDFNRLMFDLNVVARKDIKQTYFPSPYAIGTELATTFYYATIPSGRLGIYSEYTVSPIDMALLSYAVGSNIEIQKEDENYLISASKPFELMVTHQDNIVPYLNNEKWPFSQKHRISIPSGNHSLIFKKSGFFKYPEIQEQILFNGDISELSIGQSILSFRYFSPTPVSISFTPNVKKIRLDKREIILDRRQRHQVLEKGHHYIEISGHSPFANSVGVIGYFSSTIFYFMGILAVAILIIAYLYIRIKK